eukprot:4585423-Pleurochrysis_carterae.AAC.1
MQLLDRVIDSAKVSVDYSRAQGRSTRGTDSATESCWSVQRFACETTLKRRFRAGAPKRDVRAEDAARNRRKAAGHHDEELHAQKWPNQPLNPCKAA